MLKINNFFTTLPQLTFQCTNDEGSNQKEDTYNQFLKNAIDGSINGIFDNEVTEFKPDTEGINYYIYFSSFKNTEELNQLKPNLEDSFEFHVNDSLSILSNDAKKTITNPKTFLQSVGIPVPKPFFHFHQKEIEVLEQMPYVILDPIEQLTVDTPTDEGIPVFYNSFALPFSENLPKWDTDALGFSNKTFLYNSFLLMDFYTTNNPLTQKKIMSIPVYVNGRYMDYETNTKGITQLRPCFYLNNNTEGFSIMWLKNYNLNNLYIKYSFWDALNGDQLPLIPSSLYSSDKKWVQNPNAFKQENLYLECRLNYTTKNYGLYEYNNELGTYNIKVNTFDLYELIYDEYFSKLTKIPNEHPVNSTIEQVKGDDIILFMTNSELNKQVDTNLNNTSGYDVINKKYNQQHKGILAKMLHSIFEKQQVALKDKALSYFEKKFDENSIYNQDLGTITIKNTFDKDLLIKNIFITNVSIENKNNFIQGDVITVNKYYKTPVTELNSAFKCDTIFTFPGSNFYKKLNPIRVPYDSLQTAVFNHQATLYDNYYYDESNNKIVEKPKEDINAIIKQVVAPTKKISLFVKLLTGGAAQIPYILNKKQYNTTVKGLTMNDKELNLLLRNDVLEKGGTTKRYESLFPANEEKLKHKKEDYRDFSVTILTSLQPQYDTFEKGLEINLNTDMIFGSEFFKLFISTNDDITIKYNVNITFMDTDDKLYNKIIPCSLKYT